MKIVKNDLLLDNSFAPITSSMGFVEESCKYVVEKYQDWYEHIKKTNKNVNKITVQPIKGKLNYLLPRLLPLRLVSANRLLFIPTDSKWTAIFSNYYRGIDQASLSFISEEYKVRSIWLAAIPEGENFKENMPSFQLGTLILEVYNEKSIDGTNLQRRLALEQISGLWIFDQYGHAFDFENVSQYSQPQVENRFTLEMMIKYLNKLGLIPFKEEYYLPISNKESFLLDIKTKTDYKNKRISL